MDEWMFLNRRYQEGKASRVSTVDEKVTPCVANFYRLNHQYRRVDYDESQGEAYFGPGQRLKEHLERRSFLNTLVDDSDPDTD